MELPTHCDHEHHHHNIDHVFEHCITFTLDCFVCSIDVQPEPEATPFVEDTVIETSSARQATPPFDHVDKNPIPSLSLMHEQDDHLVSIITTILADIGVVCDHVAPATVTAYMHVQCLQCWYNC